MIFCEKKTTDNECCARMPDCKGRLKGMRDWFRRCKMVVRVVAVELSVLRAVCCVYSMPRVAGVVEYMTLRSWVCCQAGIHQAGVWLVACWLGVPWGACSMLGPRRVE
jgi:hypothetical protein